MYRFTQNPTVAVYHRLCIHLHSSGAINRLCRNNFTCCPSRHAARLIDVAAVTSDNSVVINPGNSTGVKIANSGAEGREHTCNDGPELDNAHSVLEEHVEDAVQPALGREHCCRDGDHHWQMHQRPQRDVHL